MGKKWQKGGGWWWADLMLIECRLLDFIFKSSSAARLNAKVSLQRHKVVNDSFYYVDVYGRDK